MSFYPAAAETSPTHQSIPAFDPHTSSRAMLRKAVEAITRTAVPPLSVPKHARRWWVECQW